MWDDAALTAIGDPEVTPVSRTMSS